MKSGMISWRAAVRPLPHLPPSPCTPLPRRLYTDGYASNFAVNLATADSERAFHMKRERHGGTQTNLRALQQTSAARLT